MIKNLRKKFTIVAMCSMFVVLAAIMGVFNVANYISMADRADRILAMITNNNGTFPSPPSEKEEPRESEKSEKSEEPKEPEESGKAEEPEDAKASGKIEEPKNTDEKKEMEKEGSITKKPPVKKGSFDKKKSLRLQEMSPEATYDTRYFTVWLDGNGTAISYHMGNIAAIGKEEAKNYAEELVKKDSTKGFQGIYRYRKVETEKGSMIAFLDRRREFASFQNNLLISLSVSLAGFFAVFVLVMIFSKIVFRPVAESYQRQKQFITDASHEIKTPLTIIDANTEVIEMDYGENEWTKSIRNQVERLSLLTKQLVMLSRLDEGNTVSEKFVFSLSDVVKESAGAFWAVALKEEKKIEIQVEEDIAFSGDEKAICQLIHILMDNAVKYSVRQSSIRVFLQRKGRKILLEVSNQAENLPKGNLDVLFERFYRMDSSRNSKTGGSGIGLSIARAIVQVHKGKITAKSDDGQNIRILVVFSI